MMRKKIISLLLVFAFIFTVAPIAKADSYIWSRYGEVIGIAEDGIGGTDLSKSATNAVCNPNFIKTKDNEYVQRYLTATNGTEPKFADSRNEWAREYIAEGYVFDQKTMPSFIKEYAHEFGSAEEAQEVIWQAIISLRPRY